MLLLPHPAPLLLFILGLMHMHSPHLFSHPLHSAHNLAWSSTENKKKSKLCPTNTHTCTLLACTLWFTVTHSLGTISWKVGQRSGSLMWLFCIWMCLFDSFCMYVRSQREKEKPEQMWNTNGAQGPAEGYPDRPQNSPKQHPASRNNYSLCWSPRGSHTQLI